MFDCGHSCTRQTGTIQGGVARPDHRARNSSLYRARLRRLDTGRMPLQQALLRYVRLQFRLKEPHYRFVRVFFAQMFLRTHAFTPFMREIHELTGATTESFFRALQARRAIRADVEVEDVSLVFTSMMLGLFALWAIEGPPFHGANDTLRREVALFCEGLEPKKR
jgi:hypothetical protein